MLHIEVYHSDAWWAIMEALIDSPVALMRFSRVCRSMHLLGAKMIIKGLTERAAVFIEGNPWSPISIRPFTDDADRGLDHNGYKRCEIAWGNIRVSVRRYRRCISVRVFIDDVNTLWGCERVEPYAPSYAAALAFVEWVLPGVCAG